MQTGLRRTPLYNSHLALKARMVEFAGWDMPVMYAGILEEARAVRSAVGMFDISHMGRVKVGGAGATALLQQVTCNNVEALRPCEAQYSLLTNPQGGIIDDIIVYRQADNSYLVVVNASNATKDLTWMRSHASADVTIEDQTDRTAMIAVQGPQAPELVADLARQPQLLQLGRFQYGTGEIAGAPATFCRTGYTGEDGFEVIMQANRAEAAWNALLQVGITPCGLGARDALRIEAGYPLYGHEIDDTTSPVEAGLMWVVKLDKGDFIGRESIAHLRETGPNRRLMGLTSQQRIQPRQGYTIYAEDKIVGAVTSGVFSPTRGHSLAMGYIAARYARAGTPVTIAIRDKRVPATVVQKKSLLAD